MRMKAVVCGSLVYIVLFAVIQKVACDNRRPEYIIGHMTNSIEEVIPYLNEGANVLESDIQFYSNGSIKEAFHGCLTPTDCFRVCNRRVDVDDYLKYLRNITDPSRSNSYYNKFIMLMFDLKLDSSNDKGKSMRELARYILDYLWTNGERQQEIRALVYIDKVEDLDYISYFLQEFQDRNQISRLKDVGFDGGSGDLSSIKSKFEKFNIKNIWLGNGIINCISPFYPKTRLKEELDIRNSGGFVKKVYDWTIDLKYQMRQSLDLGVDGFITNIPKSLVEVLGEEEYKDKFRVATPQDPPFERFKG